MNIHEAREIISDNDARMEMLKHRLEMDISDPRSATQYIAEIIIWVCAENESKKRGGETVNNFVPVSRINRTYNNGSSDSVPYFA